MKKITRAHFCEIWTAVLLSTGFSQIASADFLDTLKTATQKLKDATQQMEQQNQQQQPAGSKCGALGAGCLNYMDSVTACMAPLKGYYAKTAADVIERRLTGGAVASKKANLKEDLQAYQVAAQNGTDTVDQKISGRLYADLPQQDMTEINRRYADFHNQILHKCEDGNPMDVGH